MNLGETLRLLGSKLHYINNTLFYGLFRTSIISMFDQFFNVYTNVLFTE